MNTHLPRDSNPQPLDYTFNETRIIRVEVQRAAIAPGRLVGEKENIIKYILQINFADKLPLSETWCLGKQRPLARALIHLSLLLYL